MCNPQLLVDLNWTRGESTLLVVQLGIPVLAFKYECPYGLVLRPHADRPDVFCHPRWLELCTKFCFPPFRFTLRQILPRLAAFVAHLADSFVYNKSY